MFIVSYMISAIIIALIGCSPFLLRFFFNEKKCTGYGLGIICLLISLLAIIIIATIFISILSFPLKNKIEKYNNKKIVTLEDYLHQPAIILFLIFMMILLIDLAVFIILYIFMKRFANLKYKSYTIFTFISGYILLFIPIYLFLVYLSLFPEDYEIHTKLIDELNLKILLILNVYATIFMLKLIGVSIMLFLHQKIKQSKIIIFCLISYFAPILFLILGFSFHKDALITYPTGILDFICFILGILFYCIYYGSKEIDYQEITLPQFSSVSE